MRQLAAIMFTDIVGYSALMSKDESAAMFALSKNREIQKMALDQFHGKFIKEIEAERFFRNLCCIEGRRTEEKRL